MLNIKKEFSRACIVRLAKEFRPICIQFLNTFHHSIKTQNGHNTALIIKQKKLFDKKGLRHHIQNI